MRKNLLLMFMGIMLFQNVAVADVYKLKHLPENDQLPSRTPTTSYVSTDLNEATGILALLCVGNVGSMEVTISQNGVTIENDVIAVSNGQSVIYNLSGYAIGEYLLTIETADGAITQYIIYVEDD